MEKFSWERFSHTGWCWVLLGFLLAATRCFEFGIGYDPAVFASVSRNLAHNWHWWSLTESENLFRDFTLHPFLILWIQGFIFKVLAASDATSRIVPLVFGCGAFYYFYRLGDELCDARLGCLNVFALCLAYPYVGRLSSFYLDVPLVFFLMGSIFYFCRSVRLRGFGDQCIAGVFLGCAFLTKGLAALPTLGALFIIAFWRRRFRFLSSVWALAAISAVMVSGFCLLQARYGSYVFFKAYFTNPVLPGMSGQVPFHGREVLWGIFSQIPLHVIAAALVPWACRKEPRLTDAAIVGVIVFGMQFLAQSFLTMTMSHYYHSLYALISLLTAVFLYAAFPKLKNARVASIVLTLAIVCHVLLNWIPLRVHRTASRDFFQLIGLFESIRATDPKLTTIDAIGMRDEWIYRHISLWYWDVDSRVIDRANESREKLVLFQQNRSDAKRDLAALGYVYCASTEKYLLYAKPELEPVCRRGSFANIVK